MSEQTTEYRVVAEQRHVGEVRPASAACGESLSRAEARAEEMRTGSRFGRPYRNVRIQSRTVTETDWEDIR
jgi:hypothetical protein